MQNCSFRQKVYKQHSVVLKQLNRFCNSWQGRIIQPSKIDTYCNLVDYITQLHSSYVYNCMEYFTPIMREQMINVNKTIVQDLVKKIKYFAQYSQKSAKSYQFKEKKQICQICSNKIRQVDTRIIKQHLSDDASLRRNLLRKIYADLENQNADLFSKDEDEMFFKFLNIVLVRKQEMLAMQTKQLNGFLNQVTKSLTDLNFLTQFAPGNTGVTGYRQSYKQDLSKTITQSLKSGFDDKIHPWIQKVFESIKKQILVQKNAGNLHTGSQTDDDLDLIRKRSQYITAGQNKRQVEQLKQEIQKSTLTITDLKSKLTVLQKQKKQLQQQYTKQVESLLLQKRQIQVKLRKTQSDFYHLKQTNEQIIEVNKRLRSSKKNTQQSLRSNRSIKDTQTMSRQQQDGINQGKSEKSEGKMIKKKKKSPVNKLLSKRSQSSQKALFIQEKSQLLDKQKNNQTNSSLPMKKTVSEVINDNRYEYSEKQYPKLQKKQSTKKSLKNLDHPLSRKQKSSQNQQKVEFKLQQQRSTPKMKQKRTSINYTNNNNKNKNNINNNKSLLQMQKSHKSITEVNDQQQQMNGYQLMKKKSSFMNEKTMSLSTLNKTQQQSQKQPFKNMKRMLSIQMSMPNLNKRSRQQQRQQQIQHLQTTVEENQQGLSTIGEQGYFGNNNNLNNTFNSNMNYTNKSNKSTGPNKKVFQYVPLQNQRQYQQLKQKVVQVTTKIQSKNTQKLKCSIKLFQQHQYHQNDTSSLSGQMGRVYGYSIFNDKKSMTENKKVQGGYQDKDKSNEQDNSYQLLMNDSIYQQQEQYEGSTQQQALNNNIKKISKGIQTTMKDVIFNNNNLSSSRSSLLNNIPLDNRTLLYEQMKGESLIPKTLTFEHYEAIVRRLFGDLCKQSQVLVQQQHNNKTLNNNNMKLLYQSRPSSLNHNNNNLSDPLLEINLLSKIKQTERIMKINIDSKLLEQNISKFNSNKIHQSQPQQKQQKSKLILNLPKLDRAAYHNNSINKLSPKTITSNNNNYNNRSHFNINTMRERLNMMKSESSSLNKNDFTYNNDEAKFVPQKDQQQQSQLAISKINKSQQKQQQSIMSVVKTAQNTPPSLLKFNHQYHNNTSSPNNKYKYKQVFRQDDLFIFFDSELAAFEYEQKSKYNNNESINNKFKKNEQKQRQVKSLHKKLNQHQLKTIQSLYSILIQIRQKNHQVYHKVCSFLKYPYQTVKHGFEFINIGKDISFQKWSFYLIKLFALKLHRQSNKLTFSEFIKPFEQKLVQLIIQVNI